MSQPFGALFILWLTRLLTVLEDALCKEFTVTVYSGNWNHFVEQAKC